MRHAQIFGTDRAERATADAHIAVLIFAIGDQGGDYTLHNVDGDGETHAAVRAAFGADLRVHADDFALFVEQWPTGIAGVDGGVGLDRVGDAEIATRRNRATNGADNAAGQGSFQAEGVADGGHAHPNDDLLHATHAHRNQRVARWVNAQHRKIAVHVGANHLGNRDCAVTKGDLHLVCAFHHMVVGDNMPVEIPDKAGAAAKGQQPIGVKIGRQRVFGNGVAARA